MRVLITRPEPDAQRTAQALRERGHDPIIAPMLRFELHVPAPDLAIEDCGGVVVTSVNALRALEAHPRFRELLGLPLFAVGTRTASHARELGFRYVEDAIGDAAALVSLIAARAPFREPLLYPAAEDRAHDLAGALGEHEISVRTAVLYGMAAVDAVPEVARTALVSHGVDAVVHYSRRTAESYIACAGAEGLMAQMLAPAHLCLSAQVAEPLLDAGAKRVRVAPRPDEPALLQLLD